MTAKLKSLLKKMREEAMYHFILVPLKNLSMRVAIASYVDDIPRCLIILHQPTLPEELKKMKENKDVL